MQRQHPRGHQGLGGQRERDRDPLHDGGLRRARCEHDQRRRAQQGENLNRAGDHRPPRVGAKPPRQEQRRGEHRCVGDGADHVMDLVVPRLAAEARAGQQHVIAAEGARGDGRHPAGDDQPRPRRPAPGHRAQRRAEPDRAHTEHHEPGDHDLRIPGVLGGQAAELNLCSRASLPQRAGHPRGGEQHRARDATPCRQLAEPHSPTLAPPSPAHDEQIARGRQFDEAAAGPRRHRPQRRARPF